MILCFAYYPGIASKITAKDSTQKISLALSSKLEKLSPSEKTPVAIWINEIDSEKIENLSAEKCGVDKSKVFTDSYSNSQIQSYIETKRAVYEALYTKLNQTFVLDYLNTSDVIYVSKYSPVILAHVSKADAELLSKNSSVISLEAHSDFSKPLMDLSINAIEANTIRDSKGYTGVNVKVGILDGGIPILTDPMLQSMINNEDSSSQIIIDENNIQPQEEHATMVASIIAGQATTLSNGMVIEGIAPDATLYCAATKPPALGGVEGEWMSKIEWLLSKGVNIINISVVLGEDGYNTYGAAAKWLDHVAVNHDVHIVKAAGNSSALGITSGRMAYNVITVGSIKDNDSSNKSQYSFSGFSSSGVSATSERALKPDICAPGEYISTALYTECGTSFAAPHVTGVIAQICQIRPGLKGKQDVVKAILTAAVDDEIEHKYLPSDTMFAFYGAGMVNSYACWYSTANGKYASSYFTPSETEKTFTMAVSSSDTLMRVSLSWIKICKYNNSNHVSTPTNIYPLANLDIRIYAPNGNIVASSTELYGNLEIAEFIPIGAGNYTIKITQTTPSTYNTYFGVAWY